MGGLWKFSCCIYVICAAQKKKGKLDLAMRPDAPEITGDHSSSQSASTDTASLMGRNIVSLNREVAHLSLRLNWSVDRLHVRLVALEDQALVAFCFRAWPGNTRRRRSES